MKKLYLEKMIAGRWGGTMCLTEPDAGSDVGALKTKAVKQTDGTYLITGQKIFISAGENDLYENIIHPVLARIEGDPPGTKGISIFLVPKFFANPDGTLGRAQRRGLLRHRAQDGHQGLAHLHPELRRQREVRGLPDGRGAPGDEDHVPDDERGAP